MNAFIFFVDNSTRFSCMLLVIY